MKMMPAMDVMMPVIRRYAISTVTDAAIAKAATAEHRRDAKTTAVDGDTATSKSSTMKCRSAAAEAAAGTEASSTAMKAATTAKTAAAVKASATMAASATYLDRHSVGCVFR
jgi:hypothetical protein